MNFSHLAGLITIPALLFAQAPNVATADPPAASEASSATSTATATFTPLTPAHKAEQRALRLVEPLTLVGSAFGAGIDQWRDVPKRWGQGSEGYAIRFASAEGFTAAHNGVALISDVAFHLDPRYRRMPGAGFKARLWNAVSQTFIANKDSGGKTINVSELTGNFGAGFIANYWQPRGYDSTGDALTRGALGLAYHTLKNVAREFVPDLLHHGNRAAAPASGPHS